MANIKYKSLLPGQDLNITVNTKLLPNKGTLVYEYNPLRNYRLNEIKYFYLNKYYSELELYNDLNIISNVLYVGDHIMLYNENKNWLETIKFTIDNKTVCVPYNDNDNDNKNFVIHESELLGNTSFIELRVVRLEVVNGFKYYLKSNNNYISGVNNGNFEYSNVSNNAITGSFYYINLDDLKDLSIRFHHKSNKFLLLYTNSSEKKAYPISTPIYKFHPGSLVDFVTDELKFSLEHPVQILPLYAYDGSVNLIMTDGFSKPRLINTRFSTTGKNTYLIVDRKGNNDTNIYDLGESFDIDTSLYKLTSYIPKLDLHSVYSGGLLPVGNYHFYLTYADSDGNETDFIAESGLISLFIGTDSHSIRQGFRNENTFKGIKLLLSNIDPSYSYVNVYYTRSTGDILLNAETLAYKLAEPIFITNTLIQEINITGYEEVRGISVSDINPLYQIIDSAETVSSTKNMLFFGNILKQTPNFAELLDLALYFTPRLDTSEVYNNQNEFYDNSIYNTYQDPSYIYNKVGYWPEEIYRFGVVFILPDNTLTPVFNVRGINDLSENTKWSEFLPYDRSGNRLFIDVNENTHLLIQGNTKNLENAKGVVRFHSDSEPSNANSVFGIKFEICEKSSKQVLQALLKVCKGFFFVRLRRIPTVLCEAMTIGIEKHSHHPCIPISSEKINILENKKELKKNTKVKLSGSEDYTVVESSEVLLYCPYASYPANTYGYVLESFMNMHREIVNNFELHLRVVNKGLVDVAGMICPDYDLNYPYYNSIFNGSEFTLLESGWLPEKEYLHLDLGERHAYPENYVLLSTGFKELSKVVDKVKILGVEDSTPLVGINNQLYSGVAGISSMGYKFDYIGTEDKTTEANNLIRGIWGPFLAIDNVKKLKPCKIYTIMIPGYNYNDMENYFKIRYSDKTSYYAISERFLLSDILSLKNKVFYRGDCYICLFTHRINRNFNDDSAPYNDVIVNKGTWRGENNGDDEDHKPNPGYEVKDGTVMIENFEHINLGDINASLLGHWVTFLLRSSLNLNIRAIDESDVNEVTKIGHGKGFYPYFPMSSAGSYKTREALCVNKGYEKSVSERYNYTYPDIPALKNVFSSRIIHSQLANSDAFKNGFRVFKSTNFADYLLTYGSITKLLEWKEGLLIIFEHGIGWVSVNERALVANASGGNVYLQTDKVLPRDFEVISDCFGSLWKDSIIKTPYAVYGVDTTAKKIWKFDSNGLQCISDRTVQSFLNRNISLTERELTPILGLRNVKTHYNKFKNDIMFTFYDDLDNSLEKVWNLCYNENMLLFITFYSWVPSYSENIYNSLFSFDRLTSKWITKLGLSKYGNSFSQNITISESILKDELIDTEGEECVFGNLSLLNINNLEIKDFEILRDNFLNYKLFNIKKVKIDQKDVWLLVLSDSTKAIDLVSELFYRTFDNKKLSYNKNGNDNTKYYNTETLKNAIKVSMYLPAYIGSDGRKVELESPINKNKLVYILNIRCKYLSPTNVEKTFDSSIAVTLQYNLLFLSTDFWRHGQAGIIDISEKLKPTHWYGKLHPFEFEFVVNKHMSTSKIFDNLIILSNCAEPESFHYQIDGDCYDFSKDKANMYYRQEATEAFYQYHGHDIEYDSDFTEVKDSVSWKHLYRNANMLELNNAKSPEYFVSTDTELGVKSTILPLYYSRINSYNEIEDYYKLKTSDNKNYDSLSGGEIVRDPVTNTYKLWVHSKAVNIDGPGGRLRGNMQYNEDRWKITIDPINIRLKNELKWKVPPIVTDNMPIPNQDVNISQLNPLFPKILLDLHYNDEDNLDTSKWDSEQQIKLRDKYLRVRIRYSGKELVIIQAIQTFFRLSFS